METVGIVTIALDQDLHYMPGLLAAIRVMHPKPDQITVIHEEGEFRQDVYSEVTQYVHRKNRSGTGVCVNNGVDITKTDWIVLTGVDDRPNENYLEELHKVSMQCDIFVPSYSIFGDENSLIVPHQTTDPKEYLQMLKGGNQLPVFAAFRRSLFFKVDGYPLDSNNHMDDYQFWVRCMKLSPRIARTDKVCFRFMMRRDSKWNTHKHMEKELRERILKEEGL